MSIVDAYGEFEAPEQKSRIEIVENPFNAICSSYELFKALVQKEKDVLLQHYLPKDSERDLVESLYSSAVRIFEEKPRISPKTRDLLEFFKVIGKMTGDKYDCYYATGLFLSALQNTSNLDTLIIDDEFPLKFYCIGYRLLPDKKLVVNEEIECFDLGWLCNGGVVINKGIAKYFGACANKGLMINENTAVSMGNRGKGGIFVNRGAATQCANCFEGGIAINNKYADQMGCNGVNGIVINKSKVKHFANENYKDLLIINEGEVDSFAYNGNANPISINFGRTQTNEYNIINFNQKVILKKLVSKLKSKLAELDFLDKINEDSPEKELFKQVDGFDTAKFEKEARNICKIIKEKYNVIMKRAFY